MKRLLFVLGAMLFLMAPAAVPQNVAFAAADATCTSDPASGPVGTRFLIVCSGFTPNRYVYAYLVEPTGAAGELFNQSGAIKVKEDGSLTYTQQSKFENIAALQTGTWTFVAEELGLAKTVKHRGEVKFTVTGGTEGVSGAALSSNPSTIHKPPHAYDHIKMGAGTFNTLAFSEPVTIHGDGFAPNEIVTFWLEPANGGCPTMTEHTSVNAGTIAPGVVALYAHQDLNTPIYDGLGAQLFADAQADAKGQVTVNVYFTSIACEGAWRFVARGNGSGSGAATWVTVIGNTVATNAWLAADPGIVSAMFGTVHFNGVGFGANEHVSCWLTSPQGRTLGYPSDYFVTYSTSNQFLRNQEIRADAGGNIAFSLVTGSLFRHVDVTISIGGITQQISDTVYDPVASEGALGEYAMTCRGDTSGNAGIARFTLTGGFVDP